MMMLIFGIMLVVWCGLMGWYLHGRERNWLPTIITSVMAMLFIYTFFEMYRQGAGKIKLLLAGVIGVVIVFMEYGILDYALNTLKKQGVKESEKQARASFRADDEYELEEVNRAELSNEIRERTAVQFDLREEEFNPDEELRVIGASKKYVNVMSRCRNFEKTGKYKLALRLYEDCLKNSDDNIILQEAEEGVIRCKEQLAG